MRSKMFSVVFGLIVVMTLCMIATQAFVAYSLYSACIDEGKAKSVCIKNTMREVKGNGHNISIEQ